MDRTGQVLLGKYELTRLLGKGGMGEVWAGEHNITGRQVAVKVLSEAYLQNQKVVKRFGREARAASAVQHPGIVEILDQDMTPDGVPFLVMEWLKGESVADRVRDRGRLSQEEALAIILPLLDALQAAHENGVIHRDLKPDNVFLLPADQGREHVKILDFGISQKADEINHNLTQEGSVLGTPHYMSPEQARGEAGIDARVDVYATAVMLYECVVGDVPFDAGNYNALLQIILGTPPVPPRSRGAQVSAPVEQVILTAMAKDREQRPASARAFHDLLLAAREQPDDAVLDPRTLTFRAAADAPALDDDFSRPPAAPRPLSTPAPRLPSEPPPFSSGPPSPGQPDPFSTEHLGAALPAETPVPLRPASDAPDAPFPAETPVPLRRDSEPVDVPFRAASPSHEPDYDGVADRGYPSQPAAFSDAPPGASESPAASSLPVEPMESLAIDEDARRVPRFDGRSSHPPRKAPPSRSSRPRAGSLNDRPVPPPRSASTSMAPVVKSVLTWLVLLAVAGLFVFVTRAVFFKEDPKAARRRLLEQQQRQRQAAQSGQVEQ